MFDQADPFAGATTGADHACATTTCASCRHAERVVCPPEDECTPELAVPVAGPVPKAAAGHSRTRGQVLLHAVLTYATDLVVVVDPQGRVAFVNAAAERLLGAPPEHWEGREVFELVHPEDVPSATEAFAEGVHGSAGTAEPVGRILRVAHADGSWRLMEILANNLIDDPRVGGMVLSIRDVSERLKAQATALRDRRRFEFVFDLAPIGMALVDAQGRLSRVNAALCDMLGRPAVDLVSCSIMELAAPRDRARAAAHAVEVAAGGSPDPVEVRFFRPDGSLAWARVHATVVLDEDGAIDYSICHLQDVTVERRRRDQLEHAATHDDLTDTLNRTGLSEVADAMESLGALLFIDLDGFKAVNDTLGHQAGDEVLRQVVARVRAVLRPGDHVARIGGDEFAVLLGGGTGMDQALAVGERIREAVAMPFHLDAGEAGISASVGVAEADDLRDLEALLEEADQCAYRAKRSGGNAVRLALV